MSSPARTVLITPPLVQLNSPYPAVPVLTSYLRSRGHQVCQRDFALEVALRIFTPEIIRQAAELGRRLPPSDELAFFLEASEDYANTILPVISFLQGRSPELGWRIARRLLLPEGPHFQELESYDDSSSEDYLEDNFGRSTIVDRAKYLSALYLDDLAVFLSQTIDRDFGFGKYAEHLALALPSLDPILERLEKTSLIDEIIDNLTAEMLQAETPDFVGLAIPFPGTLYGAFRIARQIRRINPQIKIVFGGGYVNSELRQLTDLRLFDYADFLSFDEGFRPLASIIEDRLVPAEPPANSCGSGFIQTAQGFFAPDNSLPVPAVVAPTYDGLDLQQYFPVCEMTNPMHRLWSDGVWLKIQLARGCYWHRCAFCDLSLDYIGRYEPARASEIVDVMERLIAETGRRGFHFVDEAVAPSLLIAVSKEIIRRKLIVTWWGNIRFEKAFTAEVAQLMADAGCLAVTGGLECANDRLLTLMHKGITCASARQVFANFAEAGILVHAYLMYAFPTETRAEAISALNFVRQCFRDGILHSAFWHRFALTAHSYIAAHPDEYKIRLLPESVSPDRRFARNEIPYAETHTEDWDEIGRKLSLALYNYEIGLGLDMPASKWFN